MPLETSPAANLSQPNNNWIISQSNNDTIPNSSTVKWHKSGLDILAKSTFHGLPDLIMANTMGHRFWWLIALFTVVGCETVHMYFLLVGAMESASVTKVTYQPIQAVPFPSVTICGKPTKLLDSNKLAADNISLSVALSFISLFGVFDPLILSLSDETELKLYQSALELKANEFEDKRLPESEQLVRFLTKYTVDCHNLFVSCTQGAYGVGKYLQCCNIFRPVLTGQGICYSLDTSRIERSHSAGIFAGLSIVVNHNNTIFNDPVYFGSVRPCNFAISISNGIEQGPMINSYAVLTPGDVLRVLVSGTHLQFDPLISRNECESNPKLDLFADYTIDNCVWERAFFRSPITPNCSLAFEFLKAGFNFGEINANRSFFTTDGYRFVQCKPEIIRRTFLSRTLTYSDWVTYINVPKRQNRCPPPCDYWDYSVAVNRDRDSFDIQPPQSLLSISFSNQNPKMTETVAIAGKDYLSMAGGTLGLWTGTSVITVVQLLIGFIVLAVAATKKLLSGT